MGNGSRTSVPEPVAVLVDPGTAELLKVDQLSDHSGMSNIDLLGQRVATAAGVVHGESVELEIGECRAHRRYDPRGVGSLRLDSNACIAYS